MSVDREKINRLVGAALDGMEQESISASTSEVISAMFTLALRGLEASQSLGVDPEVFREPLERLYGQLAARPPGTVN